MWVKVLHKAFGRARSKVETFLWRDKKGSAAWAAQGSKLHSAAKIQRQHERLLADTAKALVEKLISPLEVVDHPLIPTTDKVAVLLSDDVMPEVGYRILITSLVDEMQERFSAPVHTYGALMNQQLRDVLVKLVQYAEEELSGRDLSRWCRQNKLDYFGKDEEVGPMRVAVIALSLYQYVAGGSAFRDMTIYTEKEIDEKAYAETITSLCHDTVLAIIAFVYTQMLH